MSIIACVNGLMVGDGLITKGDLIDQTNFKKITKLNNIIIGLAGDISQTSKLLASVSMIDEILPVDDPFVKIAGSDLYRICRPFEVEEDLPIEDTEALLLLKDGRLFEHVGNNTFILHNKGAAIGCGADIATMALDTGACAEVTVDLVCARNIYCGGEVQVESFIN